VRRKGGEKRTTTDREKLKTLLEILLVVGLESGSPGLEFGFEGHFLREGWCRSWRKGRGD
jgi:hypothetical protein